MILKTRYFSWIDNAIPCGKGIQLDGEGRQHLGSEDSVRQTDEHACVCSMVHLLKMVRNMCVCELCLRCQQRLFKSILCPLPRRRLWVGECSHIVQLITYGTIQRIPSWQLLVNVNTSLKNRHRYCKKAGLLHGIRLGNYFSNFQRIRENSRSFDWLFE